MKLIQAQNLMDARHEASAHWCKFGNLFDPDGGFATKDEWLAYWTQAYLNGVEVDDSGSRQPVKAKTCASIEDLDKYLSMRMPGKEYTRWKQMELHARNGIVRSSKDLASLLLELHPDMRTTHNEVRNLVQRNIPATSFPEQV